MPSTVLYCTVLWCSAVYVPTAAPFPVIFFAPFPSLKHASYSARHADPDRQVEQREGRENKPQLLRDATKTTPQRQTSANGVEARGGGGGTVGREGRERAGHISGASSSYTELRREQALPKNTKTKRYQVLCIYTVYIYVYIFIYVYFEVYI